MKGNEPSKYESGKVVRHTLNTIAGGLAGGGETSSAHKRYTCHVLDIKDFPKNPEEGETEDSRD